MSSGSRHAATDANELPQQHSNALPTLFGFLALAAMVALVPWLVVKRDLDEAVVGRKAPTITAAGWLNGDAPTPESLAGKVIVLNVWASW